MNKQSKKMQCDCTLSREEAALGEKGCGDDCLNRCLDSHSALAFVVCSTVGPALQYCNELVPRLLFIECGKTCQLDSLCSNKRFQTQENAAIEVATVSNVQRPPRYQD